VVRDAAAALETPARLFLRHPTPGDVLDALAAATGLDFAAPDDPALMSRRLPFFCEPGDCRAALAQLGAAWDVPDAVWAALPDRRVWWGPWAQAPWQGLAVPIPDALIVERDPAARALVVQPMPAIRPGVPVAADGRAFVVWSVEHLSAGAEAAAHSDQPGKRQMRLTWRALDEPDSFHALMVKAAPELGGRHVTRLGRVVAIADPTGGPGLSGVEGGALTNRNRPRYAVDVELLAPDGEPDAGYPMLRGLALPAFAAGDGAGLFAYPEVGALVRIGFDYGLPSFPYIAAVLSEGRAAPPLVPGEIVLRHVEGAELRFDARGDVGLQGNGRITLDALTVEVLAEELREQLGRVARQVAGDVIAEIGGSLRHVVLGALVTKVAGDERRVVVGGSDVAVGGDKSELVGGKAELAAQTGLTLTANLGDVLIESVLGAATLKASLAATLSSTLADVLVEAVAGSATVKGALQAALEGLRVSAGNGAGVELLAILDAVLTALQAETHGTGVGPSTPPLNTASYAAQQTQLATIKS